MAESLLTLAGSETNVDEDFRRDRHQRSGRLPRARAGVARKSDRRAVIRGGRRRQRIVATIRTASSSAKMRARASRSHISTKRCRIEVRHATAESRRPAATSSSSATTTCAHRTAGCPRMPRVTPRAPGSSSTVRSSTSQPTKRRPRRRRPTTRARSSVLATLRWPVRCSSNAGGFDERFDLYGWEDTELGVRLREAGVGWRFAWAAAIWHVKPPGENTLEVEARKAFEKAAMARRFLEKHPSGRARMATGAHGVNALRAKYLLPDALLAAYAGLAKSNRVPGWVQRLARAQLLDGIYTRELMRDPVARPKT